MNPKSLLVFLLMGIFLVSPAFAADTNSVAELQQQVQKLKAENEALKQENQVLRKLAFEKQGQVQTTTQPQAQTAVAPAASTPSTSVRQPASAPAAQQGYWMTSSSSKRHNSSCRFYGTTKGRPCGPNDGTACKNCGG
jgi:uncharacterized iron-regulated membrane protein